MTKPQTYLVDPDSLRGASQQAELQLSFGGSAPALGELDGLLGELGPDRLVWGLCGLARLMLPHFEAERPDDPRLRRVLVAAEAVYPEPTAAKREAADEGSRFIGHLGLGSEQLSGAATDAAHVVAGAAGIAAAEDPLAEGILTIRRQAAFSYAVRHCGRAAVVDAVVGTVNARVLGVDLPSLSDEAPPPEMVPLLVKQLENGSELRLGLISTNTPREELCAPDASDEDEPDDDEYEYAEDCEYGSSWEVGFHSYVGFDSGVVIGGRWEGAWLPPEQTNLLEGRVWTHNSYSGLIRLSDADMEAYQAARTEAVARVLAAEDRLVVTSCRVSEVLPGKWTVRATVANLTPAAVSGVRVRATLTVDGAEHPVDLEVRREIAPGATDNASVMIDPLGPRPSACEAELLA